MIDFQSDLLTESHNSSRQLLMSVYQSYCYRPICCLCEPMVSSSWMECVWVAVFHCCLQTTTDSHYESVIFKLCSKKSSQCNNCWLPARKGQPCESRWAEDDKIWRLIELTWASNTGQEQILLASTSICYNWDDAKQWRDIPPPISQQKLVLRTIFMGKKHATYIIY